LFKNKAFLRDDCVMHLLIGGDSELGAAAYRYLKREGSDVQATTRRRELVSLERPFFDILHSLEDSKFDKVPDAARIFVSVARLRDCSADPVGSAKINVRQTLRLIDKLIDQGIYVLFPSSNQVFSGEFAQVSADAAPCPISEYGRQKAETEAAIRERMAKGAPIAILRLSKVVSPNSSLIQEWIQNLLSGKSIQTFDDMTVAPISVDLATDAIAALLKNRLPGIYQLTGPRDVTYTEIGHYLATELGASPELVEPVSAYSTGMPKGSTPRNTTLDCRTLREKFGIIAPDVWKSLSPFLEAGKIKFAREHLPGAKLIALNDLSEVADGIYYSRYPLPLVDAEMIAFLKEAAARSPLRRARFCAHLSPDAEQHDMLIVSHRDTYVTPHRHLNKSETFVLLEGSAVIILFDERGAVEKIVKMGTPASGRPFFYRMPPRQFHSLSIESELLVFLENTKGPFNLGDREHARWAPDYKDIENGKAFIASILQRANRI
jgi:cupin fold WbuC family metalloprotein